MPFNYLTPCLCFCQSRTEVTPAKLGHLSELPNEPVKSLYSISNVRSDALFHVIQLSGLEDLMTWKVEDQLIQFREKSAMEWLSCRMSFYSSDQQFL